MYWFLQYFFDQNSHVLFFALKRELIVIKYFGGVPKASDDLLYFHFNCPVPLRNENIFLSTSEIISRSL
jgi:hypothetical protein